MLVINHGATTHCTPPIKIPNNGYKHSSRLPSPSSVQPILAPNTAEKPLNSTTTTTTTTNNNISTDNVRKRLPPKMYWGATRSKNWQYEIEAPSTLDVHHHFDHPLSPENVCVRIRSRYNIPSSPLASCLIGCRLVQKESGIKGFIYIHTHTHTHNILCVNLLWSRHSPFFLIAWAVRLIHTLMLHTTLFVCNFANFFRLVMTRVLSSPSSTWDAPCMVPVTLFDDQDAPCLYNNNHLTAKHILIITLHFNDGVDTENVEIRSPVTLKVDPPKTIRNDSGISLSSETCCKQ